MMKILRKKFVFFAMSAVTILLIILIGAISGLSWIILDRQSDHLLHDLVDIDGVFWQMEPPEQQLFLPPPNMDKIKSVRFFSILLNKEGTVLELNTDHMPFADAEQMIQYAGQITGNAGKIDGYKYKVKQLGTDRMVFFMDVSEQLNIFIMILSISSVIALICWTMAFLFVILFSGRIVRPIIAGMEKQKQFITNAGHELKTPLAIIQSNNDASTLIHGETKYSKNIRFQTQRLNILMTNLLTLSKLDEEVKLPTENTNISELTLEILSNYEDMASEKQITVSANIQHDVFLQVHKETFSQMMSLLLDNAVKYTPVGGNIQIFIRNERKHIWIQEENTCSTLPDMDPEQLFERFYRGDSARTQDHTFSGYGIGLSAARAIAENFGGKLTADYPTAGKIRFTAQF